ncbi:MAG: hypothetical protein H7Y09_02920 [Chitinophagaceae bacterium]|nr:hypothetical protein [Anaerolineae bacterium]
MTHDTGQNSLTLGLAMICGLGVTLMIVALGIGVIGANAASSTIGLLFVGGLALFVVGAIAWGGVVQPWTHFDDINVPAVDEHHGHDEDAHDKTAIVVYEAATSAHH